VTDDKQTTDNATDKCVAIGEIAPAQAISPNNHAKHIIITVVAAAAAATATILLLGYLYYQAPISKTIVSRVQAKPGFCRARSSCTLARLRSET